MNDTITFYTMLASKIRYFLSIMSVVSLIACSTQRAPVFERSGGMSPSTSSAHLPVEPGYYRVKRGDTLYRIALEHGQSYRDIAEWNNLSNPDQLEVDQVLRVVRPEGMPTVGVPIKPSTVEVRPLSSLSNERHKEKSSTKEAVEQKAAKDLSKENKNVDIDFVWPAKGTVVGFDESSKGIDILGKAGDPIRSAGDGKVVYAGSGLRGYGNLIIIKHSEIYLTAYAHNRTLLVKESESIKAGQKIAEMGSSDADRVKLHFEVRRYGKSVDPLRYLPEKNF